MEHAVRKFHLCCLQWEHCGLQVIDAADAVISLVETDSLARHFSMKSEAEDPDAAVLSVLLPSCFQVLAVIVSN